MDITRFCCICIFIASVTCIVTGNVSLEVVTNPIVFGKDVQIKCTFPKTNNCQYSRTWTCGPRYEPVVMNGVSSDRSKYQEADHKHCKFSVLTVKHFNETDVDIVYKCTFGFDSYERVLELDQKRFEYHPTERINANDIQITDNNVYLQFGFKRIFPRPTCWGTIDHEDITSFLRVHSERNGLFYQTDIHLNHQKTASRCVKRVKIACRVGKTTLHVADASYTCRQSDTLRRKIPTSTGSAMDFSAKSCCYFTFFTICVMFCVFS